MKSRSIKVDIEQNTPEWEAWRSEKIGASDVPSIMGESSYKKRSVFLDMKRTGRKEEFSDFVLGIFKDGHLYEEMMRDIISEEFNLILKKACFEDAETGYLAASFDGLDEGRNIGWECKKSEKEMTFIRKHKRPSPNYYGQVQTQLYVKNLDYVLFTAGKTAEDRETIKVLPDKIYQKKLLHEVGLFYKDWKNQKPVPPQLDDLIKSHYAIQEKIRLLESDLDDIEKKLESLNYKDVYRNDGFKYELKESVRTTLDADKLKTYFKEDAIKYYKTFTFDSKKLENELGAKLDNFKKTTKTNKIKITKEDT